MKKIKYILLAIVVLMVSVYLIKTNLFPNKKTTVAISDIKMDSVSMLKFIAIENVKIADSIELIAKNGISMFDSALVDLEKFAPVKIPNQLYYRDAIHVSEYMLSKSISLNYALKSDGKISRGEALRVNYNHTIVRIWELIIQHQHKLEKKLGAHHSYSKKVKKGIDSLKNIDLFYELPATVNFNNSKSQSWPEEYFSKKMPYAVIMAITSKLRINLISLQTEVLILLIK